MSKKKGSRIERELVHLFHELGWGACRIAGSGSTTLPSPDLIAGKRGQIFAIECKSGKNTRYIKEEQLNELKNFSKRLGATPLIAIRFNNEDWFFLKIKDLKRSGPNNYAIDLDTANKKGLRLKDIIK